MAYDIVIHAKVKSKQSRKERRVLCGRGTMILDSMLRKSSEDTLCSEGTGHPCLWERRTPSREQLAPEGTC